MATSKSETCSLVVYQNDRLAILPGDYRRVHDDGIRPLSCVSVHESWEAAETAMWAAKAARSEEDDKHAEEDRFADRQPPSEDVWDRSSTGCGYGDSRSGEDSTRP